MNDTQQLAAIQTELTKASNALYETVALLSPSGLRPFPSLGNNLTPMLRRAISAVDEAQRAVNQEFVNDILSEAAQVAFEPLPLIHHRLSN